MARAARTARRERRDPSEPTISAGGSNRHPAVGAAVDLGSNSVHLVVAAIVDHRLEPLVDESVFLGLGDAVRDGAALGSEGRAALVSALDGYASTARRHGAGAITFLGTEPLRLAADAARIIHEVESATGVPLHVLSHEEEALLTLIGVTGGRPVRHEVLVVDIGGGSSELATVGPDRRAEVIGLPLGSARLTGRHVAGDPPARADVDAMAADARRILAGTIRTAPREIIGVGGTASNLVKVHPAAFDDRTLTTQRLLEIKSMLSTEPAAAIVERYVVNPVRARLLPAGAVIVDAILEHFGLEQMRVSDASLREGAIEAVDHAGPAWRDRLAELARGWRT